MCGHGLGGGLLGGAVMSADNTTLLICACINSALCFHNACEFARTWASGIPTGFLALRFGLAVTNGLLALACLAAVLS